MTAVIEPAPTLGQVEIPRSVNVPTDIDSATRQLAALDGLATASEWARAAIVATFVESTEGRGKRLLNDRSVISAGWKAQCFQQDRWCPLTPLGESKWQMVALMAQWAAWATVERPAR